MVIISNNVYFQDSSNEVTGLRMTTYSFICLLVVACCYTTNTGVFYLAASVWVEGNWAEFVRNLRSSR